LRAARDAFFETAGERSVEIEELAHVVRRVLGRPQLAIIRERDPGAPGSIYVGDGTRFRELARRHEIVPGDLEAVIRATAAGLDY